MTRKQFFKNVGFSQPKEQEQFIELVKKYKGLLSYSWFYMWIIVAIKLGKRGPEIFSYVDAVVGSVQKDRALNQLARKVERKK